MSGLSAYLPVSSAKRVEDPIAGANEEEVVRNHKGMCHSSAVVELQQDAPSSEAAGCLLHCVTGGHFLNMFNKKL